MHANSDQTSQASSVEVHLRELGDPVRATALLLHGSGGAGSLGELPALLSQDNHVIVPSHPGFDGSVRPENVTNVGHVARTYLDMLERRGLWNVTVIGFSLGGWIAMEMAIGDAASRIGRLVLVDPIGVQTDEAHITDVLALSPEEAIRANFHDPVPFLASAAASSGEQRASQAANLAAASQLTPRGFHDPDLPQRLRSVLVPVLVVFGESERIVPLASGQTIVDSVAGPARLQTISDAGHRPQLEQPAELYQVISTFLRGDQE